jgi:hypothetical protein
MTRKALLALIITAVAATAAPAQNWAEKMFPDGIANDFGVVPHGAQLFHQFKIKNIYAVRMEITSIVPGCGCVTATASKRVLEANEEATLDVSMDARRFTGAKSVIVRVTVGPEFTSSADVKVTASSRADVVFNPGDVEFGAVDHGQAASQTVDVEYAGPLDWRISELVVGKDQPFEASQTETYRKPGKVGYQLKVTLKADAAPGPVRETLYLKTNDPTSPTLPVLVTGEVQAVLSVSPTKLSIGSIHIGETVTKEVVLRGGKAFRVLGVEGMGDGVAGLRPRPRGFGADAIVQVSAESGRRLQAAAENQNGRSGRSDHGHGRGQRRAVDKETRRQGDRETRRGDGTTAVPAFPCLPVSLSPCLLVFPYRAATPILRASPIASLMRWNGSARSKAASSRSSMLRTASTSASNRGWHKRGPRPTDAGRAMPLDWARGASAGASHTTGASSFIRKSSTSSRSVTTSCTAIPAFSTRVLPIRSAQMYGSSVPPYRICCTRLGCTALVSRNSSGRPQPLTTR